MIHGLLKVTSNSCDSPEITETHEQKLQRYRNSEMCECSEPELCRFRKNWSFGVRPCRESYSIRLVSVAARRRSTEVGEGWSYWTSCLLYPVWDLVWVRSPWRGSGLRRCVNGMPTCADFGSRWRRIHGARALPTWRRALERVMVSTSWAVFLAILCFYLSIFFIWEFHPNIYKKSWKILGPPKKLTVGHQKSDSSRENVLPIINFQVPCSTFGAYSFLHRV